MVNLVINDLEHNRQLDRHAMSSVQGGNGNWVFGWIRPYAAGGSGGGTTNFINPVFNIQTTNQTIIGGNAPITAINAPISAPTTTISETFSFASIENNILSQMGTG